MKPFLFVLTLFVTLASVAGEGEYLALSGRSYTNSCGYYSNTMGDYKVRFQSVRLPWGSKVTLIYGWKGYKTEGNGINQNFNWAYRTETEMNAVAGWTWETTVKDVVLHSRSHNQFLTGIQFVLKLEVPGRDVRYVKGTTHAPSYFQAPAQLYGNPCVDATRPLPEFVSVEFHVVER